MFSLRSGAHRTSNRSCAYRMSFKDASGKTIEDHGKYVTIWKSRAANGKSPMTSSILI